MRKVNITEKDLHRMVYNVLSEAGFRKFGSGKSKASKLKKGANLQISHAQSATHIHSTNGKELEYIQVILTHVWGDGEDLINAINSVQQFKGLMKAVKSGKSGSIILNVNIDRKDEIPNYLDELNNSIASLGEYSEKSIENVCFELYDVISETTLSSDIENAQKRSISNWTEMLSKLNDPEVRKQLLRFQTTNDYARQYGHILSPTNVKEVLSQFPSASFVAEKETWKKRFNRLVSNGAQPIIVTKPLGYNVSKFDLDKAAKECGYESFADAKIKSKNSTQVLSNIRHKANPNVNTFIKVKMYDVSETIPPSDPSKDVWMNEIGLSDNITGILNQHAQEEDEKLTQSKDKEANKEAIDKAITSRWKNRRYAISKLFERYKIDISQFVNLPDDKFIIQTTYTYATKVAPNYGIIKQTDIEQLASLCAAAICISCDCNLPSNMSKYLNVKIPENLCMAAYTIVGDLLPRINKEIRATDVKMLNNESISKNKKIMSEIKNLKQKLQESKNKINKFIKENSLNDNTEKSIKLSDFLDFCRENLPHLSENGSENV